MCGTKTKSPKKDKRPRNNKSVNNVEERSSTSGDSDQDLFISMVKNQRPPGDDWHIDLPVNDTLVKLKLDTGADCNILPKSIYGTLSEEMLKCSKTKLVSYTGHRVTTLGKQQLLVFHRDKYHLVEIKIVETDLVPV
ncbi:hypothetical protein HOLleu_31432 [Holothuria leucospilota]|uniref:Peptidase A2 domain-containing protein n=1 Tax=Holothuria leucospilota TaxID=206669 RepID=A0A9Q0YS75_HOLLE|nr:hypothetical protein HOLleu_31432 [Holothuria leucospilota]